MITCYSNCYFDVSCFGDWILNDVCEVIGRSELALKYFFSDCIDSSLYPKDMIRRLTLPYLRRCALLWQLIQSSNLAPSCNSSYTGKGQISSMDNTSVIENSYLAIELTSLRELENMFQICTLEVILQDEFVHTLAKKWCQHFCGKFKVCKYEHFYYCSPAIPFKLMQLPRIYEDLLQRCVCINFAIFVCMLLARFSSLVNHCKIMALQLCKATVLSLQIYSRWACTMLAVWQIMFSKLEILLQVKSPFLFFTHCIF